MSIEKERLVRLKLSDEDCAAILKIAGESGLSVSELLSAFVRDLVGGTHSNGSDERLIAQDWFDRCGFWHFAPKTFLRYLLQLNEIDDYLDRQNCVKTLKKELENCEMDAEERAATKSELKNYEKDVDCYFNRYRKWAKITEPICQTEEDESVERWKMEADQIMKPKKREGSDAACQVSR